MTKNTENNNEAVAQNEEMEAPKPKRTRKAPVKITGIQILENVKHLEAEVDGLAGEVNKLDQTSVLFPIVNEVFEAKKAELAKALETEYTV
jgi:hypothetical protein